MKTIGRRCGCLLLVATLLLGMIPATFAAPSPGMDNFKRERTYTAGTFSDVPEGRWYTEAIQTAYEYGLASGDNGQFDRKSNMSVAMSVTLAARLHAIYHTGSTACLKQGSPWYQVYVDYALANGIIEEGQFANYHKTNATRAECAAMLSKAIPASELPAINTVEDGAIPDVAKTSPYYDDIYRLYRAGILTGNDAKGTFTPDEPIDRVSMITIATRMVDKSLRKTDVPNVPDVYVERIWMDKPGQTLSIGDSVTFYIEAYFKYNPEDFILWFMSCDNRSSSKCASTIATSTAEDNIYSVTLTVTKNMFPGKWTANYYFVSDQYGSWIQKHFTEQQCQNLWFNI